MGSQSEQTTSSRFENPSVKLLGQLFQGTADLKRSVDHDRPCVSFRQLAKPIDGIRRNLINAQHRTNEDRTAAALRS